MEKFKKFINNFDIEKAILDEGNKCFRVSLESNIGNTAKAIDSTVDKIKEKYSNTERIFKGRWDFSDDRKEILIFYE